MWLPTPNKHGNVSKTVLPVTSKKDLLERLVDQQMYAEGMIHSITYQSEAVGNEVTTENAYGNLVRLVYIPEHQTWLLQVWSEHNGMQPSGSLPVFERRYKSYDDTLKDLKKVLTRRIGELFWLPANKRT